MRRTQLFPLCLLTILSCEGRYWLGTTQLSDPGAGGSSGTTAAIAGSSGNADNSSGGAGERNDAGRGGDDTAGSGGQNTAGSSAEGGDAGASGASPVTRDRWLASETFVSSATSQTVLSLVDLTQPEAEPIVLESQSADVDSFSADGRWLLYRSSLSASQEDVYLIAMTGERPGPRQRLFTNTRSLPCKWAPDSSKLACLRDLEPTNSSTTELVYFDTSRASLGPEVVITSVPPKSAGAAEQSERELVFSSANSLAFSYGPNDFARIDWIGLVPSSPVPLGVGGGKVVRQAADGGRVLVKRIDPNYPLGTALIDLQLGQLQVIDPKLQFSISSSFESGYAVEPPGGGGGGFGTYFYYSVTGAQLALVAEEPVDEQQPLGSYPQLARGTMVRVKQDRLLTVAIEPTRVVERVVPGNYQGLNGFVLDPSGSYISFETVDLDAEQQPIGSTTKHWLSQLQADGPAPAQLIAQGYAASGVFSPDARRLLLYGYATQSTVPVEFHLLELSDLAEIKTYDLDLPFNWATVTWSADSTFLAFIGGAPLLQSRPLFVVDALNAAATPRKVVECRSNPAPLPGCPSIATFQP